MAKNKKKNKKHRSFYKSIKPFIKDSRVLYSVLGALGAGVALGAALGSEKGGTIVDKITSTLKELGQHNGVAERKTKPDKEYESAQHSKPTKQKKSAKPFATEHTRETANN